jgi:hypothetical protein
MEEIMETSGQAILAAMAASAILAIAGFLFFNMNGGDGVITLAEYMYAALNSILP